MIFEMFSLLVQFSLEPSQLARMQLLLLLLFTIQSVFARGAASRCWCDPNLFVLSLNIKRMKHGLPDLRWNQDLAALANGQHAYFSLVIFRCVYSEAEEEANKIARNNCQRVTAGEEPLGTVVLVTRAYSLPEVGGDFAV